MAAGRNARGIGRHAEPATPASSASGRGAPDRSAAPSPAVGPTQCDRAADLRRKFPTTPSAIDPAGDGEPMQRPLAMASDAVVQVRRSCRRAMQRLLSCRPVTQRVSPMRSAPVEKSFGKAEGSLSAGRGSVHTGARDGKIATAPVIAGCVGRRGTDAALPVGADVFALLHRVPILAGTNRRKCEPGREAARRESPLTRTGRWKPGASAPRATFASWRYAARFSIPVDWGVHR